jgi:hypothetical protein
MFEPGWLPSDGLQTEERRDIPFSASSSNLSKRMEEGANCSSVRLRSRTLGSETLRSRLGGDWSGDQVRLLEPSSECKWSDRG